MIAQAVQVGRTPCDCAIRREDMDTVDLNLSDAAYRSYTTAYYRGD